MNRVLRFTLLLTLLSPYGLVAREIPSTFFGMHVLHAIKNTPWPTVPFGTLRLWDTDGTGWYQINRARGKYEWSELDKWLSLAHKHHVEVLYTFGRVPSWANGSQDHAVPPRDIKDWEAFVRAIVRHSDGRIHYWELWNEPNDKDFWKGDENTLLQLAEHAYCVIKSVDPSAVVLTPSPTWYHGSPADWMSQYLRAGLGKYADVIAFHGYVNAPADQADALLRDMQTVMRERGVAQKPLWDTEASWGIDSKLPNSDDQAAFVAQAYVVHAARGVQRFIWYAWDGSDGGATPPDKSWGSLWNGKQPLQGADAYKELNYWLVGANFSEPCTKGYFSPVWTCHFLDSKGRLQEIVWNSRGVSSYEVDRSYRSYRDLSGKENQVPSSGQITISQKPVLLQSSADQ